jgi:cyclase
VLTEGKADAALAASIFHYNEFDVPTTKAYLAERGVPVRVSLEPLGAAPGARSARLGWDSETRPGVTP